MNKKGFEMSFAWVFSLIVGAVIIFLAIYGVTKLISTSEHEINTKNAARFEAILSPLQTSVESGRSSSIELIEDTRIYVDCNTEGDFGNTIVSFSEKFGLRDEWSEPGGRVSEQANYLFAEEVIEGKEVYFFVKSVEMPFKLGEIMSAYTKSYCFVNAPDSIAEEVIALGETANLEIVDSSGKCSAESRKVCFSGDCEINVRCEDLGCESGKVVKDGEEVSFVEGFVYGGIFASKDNYECNVKRMMMRLEKLGEVYAKKAQFVASKDCNTGLQEEMLLLSGVAEKYEDSKDLKSVKIIAEGVEEENEDKICRLF